MGNPGYRIPNVKIIRQDEKTITVICPFCRREHTHYNTADLYISICMRGQYVARN
jgi:hypothetical protein